MGRPLPTGLDDALDVARVEPALAALVRERFGSATRLSSLSSALVRRRTLRYELALAGAGAPARLALVGKVYESRAAGERGFAALSWLERQGFDERPPASVRAPRPVAYLPELALLLMEEIGGRSLQRLLKDGSAGPAHFALYAEALSKLHELPAVHGAPFTLDDHLEVRCAGLAGPLASAFPELAEPIARILGRARRAESDELAPDCTVAHGDFHPGQVHVADGRLWLVDLDPLHQGNPSYDLAMVLFALQRAATTPEAVRRIETLRASFVASYFARADPRRAARVPVDLALIHLKRACKRFRWQDEDGWQATVRQQILGAEEALTWLDGPPPRTRVEVQPFLAGCPC